MGDKNLQEIVVRIHDLFVKFVKDFPGWSAAPEGIFPEGYPKHTRSFGIPIENYIIQNLRKNKSKYGLAEIRSPDSKIDFYDCIIIFEKENIPYYVNIKVTDLDRKNIGLNDVTKTEGLIEAYSKIKNLVLVMVVVSFRFQKNKIILDSSSIHVENLAWFEKFYTNPRNDYLQLPYINTKRIIRDNKEFLKLLKESLSEKDRKQKKTSEKYL